MEKNQANYFTCKKIKVTFLLSILVFFIHISTLSNYNLNTSFGKIISNMHSLILVLAQVAVPMFFIISGVLFYRNYAFPKTLSKYKSRFFSLVIPYWVWNTLCMIFDIVCSYTFVSKFFIGRQKFELSFLNVLEGIFFHKCTPFWFIFNLIIFVLACPVIYLALKNKLVGAMTIMGLYVLSAFNIGIPEVIFFDRASIIYYCIGAYIGIHYFDLFYNKVSKRFAAIMSMTSVLFYAMLILNNHLLGLKYLETIILIIFSLSLWYSFDLGKHEYYLEFQKESFLVYAMHINISSILTKLIYLLWPKNSIVALCNYILTVILTLLIICWFAIFIGRKFPKLKQILAGR